MARHCFKASKEVLNDMLCLVKVHVVFTLLLVVLREEISTCLPAANNGSITLPSAS